MYTDHARYPNIADVTGDFVYARLQQGDDKVPTAYPPKAIAAWSKRLRDWATGGEPDDLRAHRAGAERQRQAARRVRLCHP